MTATVTRLPELDNASPELATTELASAAPANTLLTAGAITTSAALLAACGGGGGGSASSTPPSSTTPPPVVTTPITDAQASRFLAQASMGATRTEMSKVQSLGYAGWINAQMALPATTSRYAWLVAAGFNNITYKNSESGFDASNWKKLINSPDTLRQRVTLALSEITVAAIDGLIGGGWRSFAAATYLDLLESHAFGNYRDLLGQISTSAPMGEYLTFRGNVKYNPTTGAMPDENYAREIMQLFSIGLVMLNLDGTPQLANGQQVETYTLTDITGLARIFTGWDFDLQGKDTSTPDFLNRPMIQIASRHETGASTFLNTTIPAGLDGATSMNQALDWIFAHQNVAPFISKQLIQKLVTSNPSPAYVQRVATVFNNDGNGVKGNLSAVISAILLDTEARADVADASSTSFGKQREPILRFTTWARAYNANSPSDAWAIGDTTNPATKLGQSPLRSPTVFNFFRPGYVPPNSGISSASLVAPEFQLTNESSVVGYVNFMQNAVSNGIGDMKADYSSLLPLADNAQNLVNELNTVIAAGQISAANVTLIVNAITSMPSGTDPTRYNRIYAALTMVLAAPEFIVLK